MTRHSWVVSDEIVTYYLYRYGGTELTLATEKDLIAKLGMSADSFKYKIRNFIAVDTGGAVGLTQTVLI